MHSAIFDEMLKAPKRHGMKGGMSEEDTTTYWAGVLGDAEDNPSSGRQCKSRDGHTHRGCLFPDWWLGANNLAKFQANDKKVSVAFRP